MGRSGLDRSYMSWMIGEMEKSSVGSKGGGGKRGGGRGVVVGLALAWLLVKGLGPGFGGGGKRGGGRGGSFLASSERSGARVWFYASAKEEGSDQREGQGGREEEGGSRGMAEEGSGLRSPG